jgi:glycosyltransferase involved in cell wall biosynthesis
MRCQFALPEHPEVRVIGQISRLVPYKGHRVLINAAHRVLQEEPNTAFLICGYSHFPGYVGELQRQAASLGISDRVRIVSYPGPVGDVWAAIDIHAHASLYDSAPIAIHESMALGLPAVVTQVGGIPDLVQDGVTGLVVPSNDPEAFAMALLRLLRAPETAHRLGAAARARHEAHFRAEIMGNVLGELFEDLVQQRRRRFSRQPLTDNPAATGVTPRR